MGQLKGTVELNATRDGALHSVFDSRTPYPILEREHHSLRESLAGLRAAVSGSDPCPDGDLRIQIAVLRDKLSARFAFEERMGHMHYLSAVWPSVEARLAQLRAEHRDMLAILDSTSAGLRRGISSPDIGATVLSVLERFDRHELEERQLLRSAFLHPDSRSPAGL